MTTATTYPNGQVLESSALTVSAVNNLLQSLTCGMIGINPPDYALVRIDWPTEGQPFEELSKDVCYLSCVPQDVEYNRIRERVITQVGELPVENWTYTKGWRISWVLYGPNSEDRTRMIHSATFMDYFTDQLSLSNLYPVPNPPEPTRIPELINARWWERSDFYIDMYEAVTETITDGAVSSLEVIVNTKDGVAADFTVSTES